jgi:WD40 repeat protein
MLLLDKVKLAAVLFAMMGLTGAASWTLVYQAPRAEAAPAAEGPAAPGEGGRAPARTDRQGDLLPPDALARLGTVRLRHGGPVSFVAFLPGGKELLSAGEDGLARVWDPATGKELRHFGVPRDSAPRPGAAFRIIAPPLAAAVSSDGKRMAMADGAAIRLWDVATGQAAGPIDGLEQAAAGLAFAPDGKTLAAVLIDGQVRLYDVATRKELRRFNEPAAGGFLVNVGALPVVLSPDGKTIATVSPSPGGALGQFSTSIRLWDAATGKPARPVAADPTGAALDPAFSPDGKLLGWATADGTVVLTDAATGKERHRLKGEGPGRFAFAADGKSVVTCRVGDRAGAVWDVATGKEVSRFGKARERPAGVPGPGYTTAPCLAVSPDGKRLASAGEGNLVTLLDLAAGTEVHAFAGHRSSVASLHYSADGKALVSRGADGAARTWEAATGKETGQVRLPEGTPGAVVSPDGKRLAVPAADGTLRVVDAATGKEQCLVKGFGPGVELTFSPDGRTLAVSRYSDAVVRLYDLATGRELRALGSPGKAGPLARGGTLTLAAPRPTFSPDGRLMAARAGNDFRIWEVATGRELPPIVPPNEGRVAGIAFAPDNRSVCLDMGDGTVSLWELATGKERRRYGKAVQAEAAAVPGAVAIAPGAVAIAAVAVMGTASGASPTVAVSPDGRTLAQVRGNVARLWDLLTGQELGEFRGHQGGVVALAFAPDGKALATGSADTTALVWDVAARTSRRKAPAEPSAAELRAHAEALASGDAARAFEAVAALAGCPEKAVPLLRAGLKPAAVVEAGHVEQLVADLDSDDFATRERASAALKQLGRQAVPALKKALASKPSAEVRSAAEGLLRLAGDASPGAADRGALRAIEALEYMATPEARELLQELARGAAEARGTAAAAAALERLAK